MEMKKYFCMILAFTILMLTTGCATAELGETSNYESKKIYTHEELTALPSEQLLDLFVTSGLIINDRLKATFTEAELQELFKSGFDHWCRGVSTLSDLMYFDLAKKTQEIYEKLTEQN